jgi:GNAT superfamily N-acetyltransferase
MIAPPKLANFTIALEPANSPEAKALVQALDDYQIGLYPIESHHGVGLDVLMQPNMLFAVARSPEGAAMACGALMLMPSYGELKRFYALPTCRGMGLGKALIAFLEQAAQMRGCHQVWLETGIHQAEALGLYARCGYARGQPFGSYVDDPLSVFMVKRLRAPGSAVAGVVTAVNRNAVYGFSKPCADHIDLLAGLGVEGDVHSGITVKHRSRVARDPTLPNLRQVHVMHTELFNELGTQGFNIRPGQLGENITTQGLDVLGLPTGTLLHFEQGAVVRVTGLRNPCGQLDNFAPGLTAATLGRSKDGQIIRKAGVMSVVLTSGRVQAGDAIAVVLPDGEHTPLQCV